MSNPIPVERLHQIARRRLAALGLEVQLNPDADELQGIVTFKGLLTPGTNNPLPFARFAVLSHDQLRFLEPPLSALQPIPFYDVKSVADVEQRVRVALEQRARILHLLANRMTKLRLQPALDPSRLVVVATAKMPSATLTIEGSEEGGAPVARITQVESGGKVLSVPSSFAPLDLGEHASAIDFELVLGSMVPALLEAARQAAAAPPPAATAPGQPTAQGALRAVPVTGELPSLGWLASRFGQHAVARVEVVQAFEDERVQYRLVATHVQGTALRMVLTSSAEPQRPIFSDVIDIARAPPVEDIVASILGKPTKTAAAPKPAAPSAASVPDHLKPHAGELWAMVVLIERDENDEVRYTMMDPEGKPYGAARVLKKKDFQSVFSEVRGGWRLSVLVDEIAGDEVIYRQLDGQRKPAAAPRRLAMATFIATFQPEDAIYG